MGEEVQTPLLWVPQTDKAILDKMYPKKLELAYRRPSMLDVTAMGIIVKSFRAACLFYQVGAAIMYEDVVISEGYNGPVRGDVDPRYAGCSRVVDGELQQGKGLCRGSHAERNAINNLTVSTLGMEGLIMMVTLHPCYECAKQIVNKRIKKLYYLWEYGREEFVTDYLVRCGVEVIHYESDILTDFVQKISYHPVGAFAPR